MRASTAVPRGQSEAAYALGMSKTQVMTTVLIPQAVRAMLPTIISQLVVTLKDTSLGFVITYEELLYAGRQMASNILVDGENPYVPVVLVFGAIYVAMCLALSALANWIEKRGRRAKTGIKVAEAQTAAPDGPTSAAGPRTDGADADAPDGAAPRSRCSGAPQQHCSTGEFTGDFPWAAARTCHHLSGPPPMWTSHSLTHDLALGCIHSVIVHRAPLAPTSPSSAASAARAVRGAPRRRTGTRA